MIVKGRPISKKRNYKQTRTGRMYLSSAWRRWEEKALWQLKSYKERHIGNIKVNYVFEMKGKLDTDIDNLVVGINDILQEAGIIDDDKNIMVVDARKYRGFKDWVTHIEITKLDEETRP